MHESENKSMRGMEPQSRQYLHNWCEIITVIATQSSFLFYILYSSRFHNLVFFFFFKYSWTTLLICMCGFTFILTIHQNSKMKW